MQTVRWIVGAAIFLALVFVSLQNAQPVRLSFFNLVSVEAPLIFVVLAAFAVGVAVGVLAGAFRHARQKREIARLRRESGRPATVPAPHGATPGTTPASGPGFERGADIGR
jgi:uncharacterized integral membrane protein